jgi:hypothetical protein
MTENRFSRGGLYARHVASLNVSNVRRDVEKNDARPAMILDGVDSLDLNGQRWPSRAPRPIVLKDVRRITQSGPSIAMVMPSVSG